MALSQAAAQSFRSSYSNTSHAASIRSPFGRTQNNSLRKLAGSRSGFHRSSVVEQHRRLVLKSFKVSAIFTKKKGEYVKDTKQEIDGELLVRKSSILESLALGVQLIFISSDVVDDDTEIGKTSGTSALLVPAGAADGYTKYKVSFKWSSSLGAPGAVLVKSTHLAPFFLNSLTLNVPDEGEIHFKCNSWIYNTGTDKYGRIFFSNKSFLPDETPQGLVKLREKDLVELRGDGTGQRKKSDRIYDYDVYNDIAKPDEGSDYARPILGGSSDFPYPRRCRTGRPAAKKDERYESRGIFPLYIPADERFPFEDASDFTINSLYTVVSAIVPTLEGIVAKEYKTFKDVEHIFETGLQSDLNSLKTALESSPFDFVKELFSDVADVPLVRFDRPAIIQESSLAWKTDTEFARQTLAGVNPLSVTRLKKFPPSSTLDKDLYGPQESSITEAQIKKYLEGLSVDEAIDSKRLFVIDYYDVYMPYVERINNLSKDSNKTYATRTLFFLNGKGTLDPIAIELCLPPGEDGKDAFRQVYTADEENTEDGNLWLLAKAYARANDAGYHQLVSHWLTTHCVMEPFILATHRQLSTMHPVYKLLVPHYLNTMEINEAARQFLISAGGTIEENFTPGKYSIEMSSKAYKDWKFTEQGLPADLLKRGLAEKDETAANGLKLVIEDHPYAVDGLEIWSAIKQWVSDYISLFYKDDDTVKNDSELQAWWDEVVNKGHADLKDDESRWYKMDSVSEVVDALTTLIWTASAHHAAVNFGQYPYAGYMPNVPTMTRRLLPEKGSSEFSDMMKDIEGYLLKTVSTPLETTTITAVLEILSSHAKNERYVGQEKGSTVELASDDGVEEAFNKFSEALVKAEKNAKDRNAQSSLKNRNGPSKLPYTLLYPNTEDESRVGGVTGQGIPNSISI